ncbi:MAG TPA: 1,4-alpha-glucan branching protein domain-containing protein [Thermoleophilaceae bacterium]|nr:1,4-alpha-glucan branching protein domain-containing protein [Thermoleophilaceae bacterium]
MSRDRGTLSLVLHSHMPYVEGFGTWPFGEEWLWEAVACVYLPLLDLLEETNAPLTLGLTPVLCDQLEALAGPAGQRLIAYLRGTRRRVHDEDAAGLEQAGEPELAAEVRRAAGDYAAAAASVEACGGDLVGRFARVAAKSPVELWTSAATHAVLPLLATDAGLRLQVATGIAGHQRRFSGWGGGFWLPECAYAPGLGERLAPHGVGALCVDQTAALGYGSARQLEPIATAAGPIAVPVDWQTVELVWSDRSGYPADPRYRDYHRGTVHHMRPWSNGGAVYSPEVARGAAREHARDFVERAVARLDAYSAQAGRPGVLCCALDTELLGHWWYEGLEWLRAVIVEAEACGLELATVGDAVGRVEPVERELAASTWGTDKDLSTWDSPRVAELAFAARGAELRTVVAASSGTSGGAPLERAARELLALQASDWPFQVTRELASEYPHDRLRGHLAAHDAALGALADSAPVPEPSLRNLAPDLALASLAAP